VVSAFVVLAWCTSKHGSRTLAACCR
jgi:hypothetical protein